jgi:hypothetical protein
MPVEQLEITEADLKYARRLLGLWSAFQRAGSPEEIMARAKAWVGNRGLHCQRLELMPEIFGREE